MYGKSQPMGLIGIMIRILTQNDHLHMAERRHIKCLKYLRTRRVDHLARLLLRFQKMNDARKIILLKFILQYLLPALLYPYIHGLQNFSYMLTNVIGQLLHRQVIIVMAKRVLNFFGNKLQTGQHVENDGHDRHHPVAQRKDVAKR